MMDIPPQWLTTRPLTSLLSIYKGQGHHSSFVALFCVGEMATCSSCLLILLVVLSVVHHNDAGGNNDFYSIDVVDADGTAVSLDKYRGMVVLVVNVASECGFTDGHYKGLVKLQKNFEHSNRFQILAFPCNQFGAQEPKPVNEILKYAQNTYNTNFPIFNKINTVDKDVAEIYTFLTDQTGTQPNWNFWKYLVNHNGKVIGQWGPWSSVEEIVPTIKKAVGEALVDEEKDIEVKAKEAGTFKQAKAVEQPSSDQMTGKVKSPSTPTPPAPASHEDL